MKGSSCSAILFLICLSSVVLARNPADVLLQKEYHDSKSCQEHCKLLRTLPQGKYNKQSISKLAEGCDCSKVNASDKE